ncbi:hypothetical protein ACFQFC_36550 [Amorphoplanes digitatis]|uniref:Putative membrane protein n=1 Tax=Actinoplanes digitatis TaxID=1868 RepID=A0A7W7HVQ1_9ACTN|nr:hypothetical protein [Actinoplanes digitatis]MBB4761671.1 putative membrane protein [Actinoplanes digitatis]GID90781.1 hypothetical protein Adi01nite_01930 [Actinoplanes digitatis]
MADRVHGHLIGRAFLLGAACGGRSMAGPAAVALTAGPVPARGLSGTRARRLIAASALAELVADKLPGVPSRLAPPALAARLVTAGASAAALARRDGATAALPVLAAVSGALAAGVAGARWRAWAGRGALPPVAAAVLEDLAVVGAAAAAVRP